MKKFLAFLSIGCLSATLFADPLDVTIKGQAREKISVERVPTPTDVQLKNTIPFSRLGQTDYVLSEELSYLEEAQQVRMMEVKSPKTYQASMIEFPKPPFFVQAYPAVKPKMIVDRSPNALPPAGENETWSFIVVDQNNQVLKRMDGNSVPPQPIQWDGMADGKFLLKADEIYSSMLIIEDAPGVKKTLVGDPIWLPALRYARGNELIFEFSNRRFYDDAKNGIADSMQVSIKQLFNELRKYEGSPFEVVIYQRDADVGQRRIQWWRSMLEKNLLKPADRFNVRMAEPEDRGDVTRVVVGIAK